MAQAEASYFTFAKGINTEASLANWPEGFSVDEENYDLLIDGSRRKRKGLVAAPWTTTLTSAGVSSGAGDLAHNTFYWNNVGGDPDTHFVLVQIGGNLNIYTNSTSITDTPIFSYSLVTSGISGATSTQIEQSDIDFDSGFGVGFIVGKYITPSSITYEGGSFSVAPISVEERDFQGQDDGVDLSTQPSSLSTEHQYNLRNRGWKDADVTTYFGSKGVYPSKAMIPWLGYVRVTTATVAEADWTKQFSPDKLVAELFQDVSAPQGHFKLSPFSGSASSGTGTAVPISTWTTSSTAYPATPTITVTTTVAHGKITGDSVQIYGNEYIMNSTISYGGWGSYSFTMSGSLDGTYTITVVDATHFTFTYTNPATFAWFTSWNNQYSKLGSINAPTANTSTTSNRPEVVAFWAGRVFYTGIQAAYFSNRIYFSQIIQQASQYGKCYQQADPTDERIADPIDTDGGCIIIPTAENIYEAVSVGNGLLVFAKNGVWQLGPGASGIFSPTSYSIRRVSDQGISGKKSMAMAEHVPYYCSLNDIFRIVQDPQAGFLISENISQYKVHTLYSSIPEARKKLIKAVYDDLSKRIIFLYGTGTNAANALNMALIFDTRLEAFTKYNFGVDSTRYPVTAFVIRQETTATSKVVYVCHAGNILLNRYWRFYTASSSTFADEATGYTAYLLTSYNTAGNAAHYKQAGYIWVFSRKTETGYTDDGNGTYLPINESSTYMQSRWEWADASSAGKWGAAQQVYRHRRLYTPADATDTFNDGTPLVVTKNLVRGRGRSLHLKFYSSDSTKDSWLMGWHTTYNIQQGK